MRVAWTFSAAPIGLHIRNSTNKEGLTGPQAFSVVFQKAMERAEGSEDVKGRVTNLIDCITYSVFRYTTRGLFERDKLIFAAQMTFQVRRGRGREGGRGERDRR